MFALWRRPPKPAGPSLVPSVSTEERLDGLEDAYRRLDRRFVRLQGEVSQLERHIRDALDTVDEEEGDYAGEDGE